MNKKYLITGSAGFIGHALCQRLLEEGHSVVGIDNFSRGPRDSAHEQLLKNNNYKFYECNLAFSFPESVSGEFDVVIHLAGVVGVEDIVSNPYNSFENNLKILFTVFGWMEKNVVHKFIYASSSEVYGWNTEIPIPTPEKVTLICPPAENSRGGYALSKINGEFLTTIKCRELSTPFTIVRLHNIYGPRMGHSHVIPQLIQKIKQNKDLLEVNNSSFTRSFCFIQDAIDQVLALTELDHNEIVNIGDDEEEIEIGQLAMLIASKMNKIVSIQNQNNAADPFKRRCPDMKKSKELLGQRSRRPLSEGLPLTIAWYGDY